MAGEQVMETESLTIGKRLESAQCLFTIYFHFYRPNGAFSKCSSMDDVDFWMSCHRYTMSTSTFVMLFCELDGGLCHL